MRQNVTWRAMPCAARGAAPDAETHARRRFHEGNNISMPQETPRRFCVNPESQCLVLLQNLETEKIQSLKKYKPEQGSVPTLAMLRNFRSSNAIQDFIQELEIQCSKEHKEFGYMIPPEVVRKGHEIQGEVPIWIEAQKHQHMKCQNPKSVS